MAAPGRPHGPVGPLDAVGCDNGPWQGPAPLQRRAGGPVRRQSTSRAVAWHWVRGTGELPAALYNGWAVTTGRYRSRDGAPRRRRHTRHATGRATGAVCRAAVGKVALWVTGGRTAVGIRDFDDVCARVGARDQGMWPIGPDSRDYEETTFCCKELSFLFPAPQGRFPRHVSCFPQVLSIAVSRLQKRNGYS